MSPTCLSGKSEKKKKEEINRLEITPGPPSDQKSWTKTAGQEDLTGGPGRAWQRGQRDKFPAQAQSLSIPTSPGPTWSPARPSASGQEHQGLPRREANHITPCELIRPKRKRPCHILRHHSDTSCVGFSPPTSSPSLDHGVSCNSILTLSPETPQRAAPPHRAAPARGASDSSGRRYFQPQVLHQGSHSPRFRWIIC